MSDADPDYREVARATLDGIQEAARQTAGLQADYGKWLTATIAATHLGGIYVIVSIEGVSAAAKLLPAAALVMGLVLCFSSGLCTYLNLDMLRRQYVEWANARMLFDRTALPKPTPGCGRIINRLMIASIIFGVASVLCLPLATCLMARNLGLL